MADAETKRVETEGEPARNRPTAPTGPDSISPPKPATRGRAGRRLRLLPVLITLTAVGLAVPLARMMWDAYMGAPWTRDGTVRAYVVTMAPEVAGRIVELPVMDNQFVHKGDVLFEIEPADYRIALEQAQAQAQRDGAALDYARENENRKA